MKMINIKQKQSGKRIDVFLLEQLKQRGITTFSRNFLTNNWGGLVKVNGQQPKPSYRLKTKDEVSIDMEKIEKLGNDMKRSTKIKAQKGSLDILFECSDFLVLDKPKGLVVHPGVGHSDQTLANYVRGYLENKGEFNPRMDKVGVVHRLDKPVTGVMVFAKTLRMQKHLKEQFERHEVNKIYLADIEYKQLRRGIKKVFPKEELDIDEEIAKLEENNFKCGKDWLKAEGYITRSKSNRVKMQYRRYMGRSSKRALSYIKPINKEQALIVIKTGRMHQIRATLEYFGIGIKGDTLYGVSKSETLPEEIGLESIFLGFKELDGDDFTIIKY
jgi:23S rRNA pseudouridine1911/1915/1917 synthase